jgi:hypothetical protein
VIGGVNKPATPAVMTIAAPERSSGFARDEHRQNQREHRPGHDQQRARTASIDDTAENWAR